MTGILNRNNCTVGLTGNNMHFMVKTVSSTISGIIGGWLGGFVGMGTGLFVGFVLSVVGWYAAKYYLNKYID